MYVVNKGNHVVNLSTPMGVYTIKPKSYIKFTNKFYRTSIINAVSQFKGTLFYSDDLDKAESLLASLVEDIPDIDKLDPPAKIDDNSDKTGDISTDGEPNQTLKVTLTDGHIARLGCSELIEEFTELIENIQSQNTDLVMDETKLNFFLDEFLKDKPKNLEDLSLEELKTIADEEGITYSARIGAKALAKKITESRN